MDESKFDIHDLILASECRDAVQKLNSALQSRHESLEKTVIEQEKKLSGNYARGSNEPVIKFERQTQPCSSAKSQRKARADLVSHTWDQIKSETTAIHLKRVCRTGDSFARFFESANDLQTDEPPPGFFGHSSQASPESRDTSQPSSKKVKSSSQNESSASQSEQDFWNNLF